MVVLQRTLRANTRGAGRGISPDPSSNALQPGSNTAVQIYSPFYYTPQGIANSTNGTQGIKTVPGSFNRRFVITGTYGNITSAGVGTVYVGAINDQSTAQGSGSGTWTVMNVPAAWGATSTSIYGPGAIRRGRGPGGIR